MGAAGLRQKGRGVQGLAGLRGKLRFDGAGDARAIPLADLVHHNVSDGVDAAGAVNALAVGNKMPAFQFDIGVGAREALEIVPVGGGGAPLQQSRGGEQMAGRAHAAQLRALRVQLAKPR